MTNVDPTFEEGLDIEGLDLEDEVQDQGALKDQEEPGASADDTPPQSKDTPQSGEAGELDPFEQKARAQGWKSREEFEAEGRNLDSWVPAREWVRRGELIKQVEERLRRRYDSEIAEIKRAALQYKQHIEAAKEAQLKLELERLRQLQREALEEGDTEAFQEAQDKLLEVRDELKARKAQQQETPQVSEQFQPPPKFVEWQSRNSWYDKERDPDTWMKATAYGKSLVELGVPYEKMLEMVEEQFAPRANPARARQSAVSAPRSPQVSQAGKNKLPGFRSLPKEYQQAFRTFQKMGLYPNTGNLDEDAKEYIQEQIALGNL